jgi:nitroreductase
LNQQTVQIQCPIASLQTGKITMSNPLDDNKTAFSNLIQARRSVRGFKPEPVDEATLRSIFTLAQHTPSNCNTQPWQVRVVSGAKCEAMRELIPNALASGAGAPDIPYNGKYEGVYRERQYAAAHALYDAMGIARDDRAARQSAMMQNYRFFDAPHAAFLFMSAQFGVREAADVGMYAQSLMLSITAHGLASCPQTTLGYGARAVRESLGVDDSLLLLFGISFGYEDETVPANRARTRKAALGENVIFINE